MSTHIESYTEKLFQASQQNMLDQLGDLVTKGLLVWESGPSQIVRENTFNDNECKLKVVVSGRFRLKDQEYIDSLKSLVIRAKETLERSGCDMRFNEMVREHTQKWRDSL